MVSMSQNLRKQKNETLGRHPFSLIASKLFEHPAFKPILGAQLFMAVVFTGFIGPEAHNARILSSVETTEQSVTINAEPITKTTFAMPLGTASVSQKFTVFHPGIDMSAPFGSSIYAIEQGYVEYTGWSYLGYGNSVKISHPHNRTSALYAHLSDISAHSGQWIERGEVIGHVGSTGWSTGNHLHLEIYKDNVPQNPLEVLPIIPYPIPELPNQQPVQNQNPSPIPTF